MAHAWTRIVPPALALALVAGGCALLDRDPSRATMAELLTGAYDPAQVEGVDLDALGVSPGGRPMVVPVPGGACDLG